MCSIVYYHNVEMWNSARFLTPLALYWACCVGVKALKLAHLLQRGVFVQHVRFNLTVVVLVLYTALLLTEVYVFTQLVSFFRLCIRSSTQAAVMCDVT